MPPLWTLERSDESDSLRATVVHLQKLKVDLTNTFDNLYDFQSNTVELAKALHKIQASVQGIYTSLSNIAPASFYAEYCPPEAKGLASRVFDIPELLEQILDGLQPWDLLIVQQVNRQFRDFIAESDTLQERFNPHLDEEKGEFYSPLTLQRPKGVWPGLAECTGRIPRSSTNTAWHKLKINKVFRLGSRVRRIPISEPPIQAMYFTADLVGGEYSVKNSNGVTIGDICDAVKKFIDEIEEEDLERPYLFFSNPDREFTLDFCGQCVVSIEARGHRLV